MDGIGHGDIAYVRVTLENVERISGILIHDEDDNGIRQPAPVKD